MSAPVTRCAIYTRKSTEEGLEQAFNSLDAQREACAAYIASQKHEGWVLSPELYDDGGFSGGNMQRPGLAALMAEVEAGRIQVIVVYKVDRLTRSLADFAKIVEVLDARGASFVSVTQSFNTTTSMGRLTLNVLLSFAQFEREVTGERIRDKIAASKAKGMWMGGPVPLGYDVRDRRLVVNDAEAATVRMIFERYLALGSIRALLVDLDASGVRTKTTVRSTGAAHGGIAFTRGSLLHLLGNRVYVGETRHRDRHYPGEHAAIVTAELFDAVQALRAANGVERGVPSNIKHASSLAGKLVDGLGRRMKPSHACKGATRYRYYVSDPDSVDADRPAWRVPAHDLEALVDQKVVALLADRGALDATGVAERLDGAGQARLFERAADLAAGTTTDRMRLVTSVALHDDHLTVVLDLASLRTPASSDEPHNPIRATLTAPAVRIRRGRETRLVLAGACDDRVDPALVGLVARARAAAKFVRTHPELALVEVAARQGLSPAYLTTLLRLATLAPDIVTAIFDGRQPATLTRQKLARLTNLPLDWADQRTLLGFG